MRTLMTRLDAVAHAGDARNGPAISDPTARQPDRTWREIRHAVRSADRPSSRDGCDCCQDHHQKDDFHAFASEKLLAILLAQQRPRSQTGSPSTSAQLWTCQRRRIVPSPDAC
jgi:hypothetical protein